MIQQPPPSPPPLTTPPLPASSHKISRPVLDDLSSRAVSKEKLASLVMKPGSARDLHAEDIAKQAAKQAVEPDPSPVLGPRGGMGGGGGKGAGLGGWPDRDWDRFGER